MHELCIKHHQQRPRSACCSSRQSLNESIVCCVSSANLVLYCGFVLLFYSKDGPLSLERGLQSLEQLQKKVRVLEEENAELKTVV